MCLHCKEQHVAGHGDCHKHQQETIICQTQQPEKVCRLRAIQLLEEQPEFMQLQTKYATHFTCTTKEENKRKMTPWLLEKYIKQQLDKSPICIRSGGRDSYILQIDSDEQSRQILNITQINDITVEIVENRFINTSKGIVYVYDYNFSNPLEYLDILGERAKSKVYEYHDNPMGYDEQKMFRIQSYHETMHKK